MKTLSPQSSVHTLDDYTPPREAVTVLHADEALLVVAKPAGLLAVPGRLPEMQDCLIHRVQQQYPDALIVHRLDMATSGLMVLARSPAAQRALSEAFASRAVSKQYVALLDGQLPDVAGSVALPLMSDWLRRPRQKVDTAGKPALTEYRLLQQQADGCRVLLTPVTGRTHQLRVHMLALGCPIVGDALYGGRAAPRLMLHAQSLALRHPHSDAWLQWQLAAPF